MKRRDPGCPEARDGGIPQRFFVVVSKDTSKKSTQLYSSSHLGSLATNQLCSLAALYSYAIMPSPSPLFSFVRELRLKTLNMWQQSECKTMKLSQFEAVFIC